MLNSFRGLSGEHRFLPDSEIKGLSSPVYWFGVVKSQWRRKEYTNRTSVHISSLTFSWLSEIFRSVIFWVRNDIFNSRSGFFFSELANWVNVKIIRCFGIWLTQTWLDLIPWVKWVLPYRIFTLKKKKKGGGFLFRWKWKGKSLYGFTENRISPPTSLWYIWMQLSPWTKPGTIKPSTEMGTGTY